MGPALRPVHDLRALLELRRLIREFRPDILHTHTAKAGALGRLAALTLRRGRPLLVHTYHGHVLEGYFGRATTTLYRMIERALARPSACLVAVSQATAGDLVRLRVAEPERIRVVPLGLELDRFLRLPPTAGGPVRAAIGAGEDDVVCTFVGRLAPIKRVDVLLRAMALARAQAPELRLVIVGDGTLRPSLEALAGRLGLAGHVHFLGYRTDLGDLLEATDIAVLASANEGTPVALIEAAAAARAIVATRVGGVPDVVTPHTGTMVGAGDERGFADALAELARAPDRRRAMGRAGRDHVRERFASERLLRDVAALYAELIRPPR